MLKNDVCFSSQSRLYAFAHVYLWVLDAIGSRVVTLPTIHLRNKSPKNVHCLNRLAFQEKRSSIFSASCKGLIEDGQKLIVPQPNPTQPKPFTYVVFTRNIKP